jgi:hypothetical protein
MSQPSHEDDLPQFPTELVEIDDDLSPQGLEDQHTRHEESMELAREQATYPLFEAYFTALAVASKEEAEEILVSAVADATAGSLSRSQFQRLSILIEQGPETLEAFTERINIAANALRPYQGRNLTPDEEQRVERLAETRNLSFSSAIELVLNGGLAEYEGNKPFAFTDTGLLLMADKILQTKYARELAYPNKELYLEARRRKTDNQRELTSEEMDEILRLNAYKLSHFKK